MPNLCYIGGVKKKYYYRIKKLKNRNKIDNKNAEVSRISCKEYDDNTKNKNLGKIKPKIGSKVIIIIKPYYLYNCKTGIVKKILTKRKFHTKGHKVILENDIIGRTLKIINL